MELFTTVMNRITGNLAAVLLPRGQPKSSSDKQEEVVVVGPTWHAIPCPHRRGPRHGWIQSVATRDKIGLPKNYCTQKQIATEFYNIFCDPCGVL